MQKISASQLNEMMNQREPLALINVLPVVSFEKEHIPGSYNFPIEDSAFVQKIEAQFRDKATRLIIYCSGPECSASHKAVKELEDAGFPNIYRFEGGLSEWKEYGFKTERASEFHPVV